MKEKCYILSLCKPISEIKDFQADVVKAIIAANRNLMARHHWKIFIDPKYISQYSVKIDVKPFEGCEKEFSRIQLKGVSMYLLKSNPVYRKAMIGTRLLKYTEIPFSVLTFWR